MAKCAVVFCEQPRTWLWQPAGPSDQVLYFVVPGHHARGFATIPVCHGCMEALKRGREKVVQYDGKLYRYCAEQSTRDSMLNHGDVAP
jgi:hypothetical protein